MIIHINTNNMMQVTYNLEGVFICDFGLAKFKDVAQGTMTTVTQHMTGTYPYMAPEMFSVSHRSAAVDIYSLGCLYIELFGRKRVWPSGISGMQIMQKVCGSYGSPPVSPSTSHLTPSQQTLCNGCCQLDYKKRLNIHEVIDLLNNC